MTRTAPALLLAACAALPGCSRPAPPAPAPPARVALGFAIPSWVHAVGWVARDAGHFERERLAVEIFQMKGSAAAMQGLLSGSLDVAMAGGDAMLRADLAGADLAAFGGLVGRHYHRLVAAPGVASPADLKGRPVGVPVLGGPQDMAVKAALRRFGLGYNTDVPVRILGAEFVPFAALSRGDAAAVTSDAPASVIAKGGFSVLADLPAWDVEFPYLELVARRPWLEAHEDTAARLLRALSAAVRDYRARREASIEIVVRNLGSRPGDPGEYYDTRGPGLLHDPPAPDLGGLAAVLADLAAADPRAAGRKAEEFVWMRAFDRVRAEGGFGPPRP